MIFFENASKRIWAACKKGDVRIMEVMACAVVVQLVEGWCK